MKPTKIKDDKVHGEAWDHPAFGTIGASRVEGSVSLNGSDFVHRGFVTVTIHKSTLHRSHGHDRQFGEHELISVVLSEAQWATFVSSMNVGFGVACTIEHIQGERMPKVEHEVVADKFQNDLSRVQTGLLSQLEQLRSHVKTKAGLHELDILASFLKGNVKFTAEQFDRHMEKTVEKAKIEINAYVQRSLMSAGMDAIAARPEDVLKLENGND